MNIIKSISIFIFISFLTISCGSSGGGGDNNNNANNNNNTKDIYDSAWQSTCEASKNNAISNALVVTGDQVCCFNEGAYIIWNWLAANFKPTPRTPLPLPVNLTVPYFHPFVALNMSFFHSADWTPTSIDLTNNVPQMWGVDLVKNDNSAMYHNLLISKTFNWSNDVTVEVNASLNYILNKLGDNTPVNVRCDGIGITDVPLPTTAEITAVTTDRNIILISTSITGGPSILVQHISTQAFAGPIDQFTNLSYVEFINILLDLTGQPRADRDADGVPDIYDHAAADPNIQ